MILDIFSRYVVGWMVADREAATLASQLIDQTCSRHCIPPGQLTLHADRGTSMKSKVVALLLSDLGVTKTHSRPHVSDDSPFAESHFRTLKCRPDFPGPFGSIQDVRSFCRSFFPWYNIEHRHSGIGLLTPESVHYVRAADLLDRRQTILSEAYAAHRGALRPQAVGTTRSALRRLDQPPEESARREGTCCSVDSTCRCLKVVDTSRSDSRGGSTVSSRCMIEIT